MDLYSILELKKTASPDEIKKAYRRLSKIYHPDINKNDQNAQAKFSQLDMVFKTLSNPKKKKEYDECGTINHSLMSEEEEIKNSLLQLFLQLIDKVDPTQQDIFYVLKNMIESGGKHIQQNIKRLQQKVTKFATITQKAKDKNNFFSMICENQIKVTNKQIDNLRKALKAQNEAVEFIEKNKIDLEIAMEAHFAPTANQTVYIHPSGGFSSGGYTGTTSNF